MKILHHPNSIDGFDYDLWNGNKIVKRFKSRKSAEKYKKILEENEIAEKNKEILHQNKKEL